MELHSHTYCPLQKQQYSSVDKLGINKNEILTDCGDGIPLTDTIFPINENLAVHHPPRRQTTVVHRRGVAEMADVVGVSVWYLFSESSLI